jgi:hypothetical protein
MATLMDNLFPAPWVLTPRLGWLFNEGGQVSDFDGHE